MPVIRIDDDVMQRLQKLAVELGLVFGSPNDVLKRLLDMEERGNMYSDVASANHEHIKTRRRRTASGSALLREHIASGEIDDSVKFGYYHSLGHTYTKSFVESNHYPVALFDPSGFVVINSGQDIDGNSNIKVGANVDVLINIENLPGYIRCNHVHIR